MGRVGIILIGIVTLNQVPCLFAKEDSERILYNTKMLEQYGLTVMEKLLKKRSEEQQKKAQAVPDQPIKQKSTNTAQPKSISVDPVQANITGETRIAAPAQQIAAPANQGEFGNRISEVKDPAVKAAIFEIRQERKAEEAAFYIDIEENEKLNLHDLDSEDMEPVGLQTPADEAINEFSEP